MYFIRDCKDQIVGNPKGYRTMRGAASAESNPRSKARDAIYAAYDARAAQEIAAGVPLEQRRRNISSIRLNEGE